MPKGRENARKIVGCAICGAEFFRLAFNHKYCSTPCKRAGLRLGGCESTDSQYKLISGNWAKYYNRLRCQKGRQGLTLDTLLALHATQGGRCALTGIEMTCRLEKGVKCPTNASVDRIDPKGEYAADNIQLVCAIINKFRIDTSVEDFIEWCRKVAQHAVCK